MTTTQKKQLVPIIAMIFLFGMISYVTNLASPVGDILKNQFTVPNWMGTLGVFANFIAYAAMGYPAGNLLQRLGYKKTSLIAITVGFVGVGIQTISGIIPGISAFVVYLVGALVAGFSMCLLNTVVNPMLNSLGGGGNKGNQLIQIGGSFNSLCGTAVVILTGILIPTTIAEAKISHVFPLMYTALAIFAFAFIVIVLTDIPEKAKAKQETAQSSQYSPLSFRHFILGAIGIFVYVGVEVGIPNILQKWLQNPDLNVLKSNAEAIAGSVAGTYWFLMLIGRLIGAAIGSKVSAKSMLSVVSTIGLVLTLAAIFAPVRDFPLPVFKGAAGFGLENVPVNAAL
ncbi:MAG: MFS transporter, partial [Bacteroidales bacterium]|nr:MFS transporter [Bacteroidales bacterium]